MAGDAASESTLRKARIVATCLLLAPVLLACAAAAVRLEPVSDRLTPPAVLAGVVALAVGFHLYRRLQAGASEEPDASRRSAAFVRATLLSLACTEAGATLGIVAFLFSKQPVAWIGLLLHVLLAGAIWPSRARMESFVAGPGGRG